MLSKHEIVYDQRLTNLDLHHIDLQMNSSPIIQVHDIHVKRQGKWVLQNVSFELFPKQIMTLIGPNGSGKTTLLKVVLGLTKPNQGTVRKQAKMNIGYMPQRLSINTTLPITVEKFLLLGKHRKKSHVADKMAEIGISHVASHPIQSISGGELQRVLLTRALLNQPHVLILDEPTQGVDVNGQAELYELISHIRDAYDCAVLMVSHDLHLVMAATDQVICLNNHICCSGHPNSVSQHPAYLSLFGDAANNIATYTHHHNHHHDIDGSIVTHPKASDDG